MIKLTTLIGRASALAIAALALASPAAAHTESDVIAVPAGEEATVKLKPTHGCGESPTVEVAIRVPVPGAAAVEVEGWTSSAADDGEGHTVVEWKGGLLPVDQDGAFPVEFDVPADQVGELLTFPAVQVCESGEELSWIDGDPEGEYPAPRLLVLPAGNEAAATIDEVPADAPGRAQLVEIVDVDGGATTTTTPPSAATEPAGASTTVTAEATPTSTTSGATDLEPTTTTSNDDDEDSGMSTGALWATAAIAVLVVLGGGLFLRSRANAQK